MRQTAQTGIRCPRGCGTYLERRELGGKNAPGGVRVLVCPHAKGCLGPLPSDHIDQAKTA